MLSFILFEVEHAIGLRVHLYRVEVAQEII